MSNRIDDWIDHVLGWLDSYDGARERFAATVRTINAAAEQQYIKAEQSEMNQQDRAEYNAILDAEDDAYWERRCPQHGVELPCTECEQELLEERRAEGFLTFQEANARSINNMWKIGEGLGPPEND